MLPLLARLSAFVGVGAILFTAGMGSASGASSKGLAAANDSADAQQSGDVQQEIGTLLDQYTQALLKSDVAALERIWADDLTFINPRGEVLTKQDRLANIKSGATAFKTIRLSDKRIRVYGQSAVATVAVALEAQYSGQEGSGEYRVTTVWARPKGAWQMVSVQMTRVGK